MIDSEQARRRAEKFFTSKKDERPEADKAKQEYEARQRALQEKTARLRALRLARDQADTGKPTARTTAPGAAHPR
jgi:hypothetical protein